MHAFQKGCGRNLLLTTRSGGSWNCYTPRAYPQHRTGILCVCVKKELSELIPLKQILFSFLEHFKINVTEHSYRLLQKAYFQLKI